MQQRMTVIQGDITRVEADVIVNAANSSLLSGGGVDGAIHRAAGPALLEACREVVRIQGECPPGHAVITEAGLLNVRAVVHTVGPVWRGGHHNEAGILAEAYRNSLQLVNANHYLSVAFPAISTGAYGYPLAEAAQIAFSTVDAWLVKYPLPAKVIFVCYDEESTRLYQHLLAQTG